MILLKFVFSGFFTFIGCAILLGLTLEGIAKIILALHGKACP